MWASYSFISIFLAFSLAFACFNAYGVRNFQNYLLTLCFKTIAFCSSFVSFKINCTVVEYLITHLLTS